MRTGIVAAAGGMLTVMANNAAAQFSDALPVNVVPEPGVLSLVGIAAAALVVVRRFRK